MSETFLLIVQVIFIIADFGLFCCSVIGNSVVIYVIVSDKKLKNKSNLHILSVAFADLLIGLFGIPLGVTAGLTGAPHDFFLCLLLNSYLLAVFAVSMLSLLAVSVDRFWAVCKPVTYHVKSSAKTKIIITCCWCFGTFFGFLPAMGWNSGQFEGKCDLRVVADLNYLLFVCVAIAFVSTVAIIVLYFRIYLAILKQAKKREEIVANSSDLMKQKNEVRAANTLAMIVGTFILLWTPGIVSMCVMAVTNNRDFHIDILELSTILVHLNSALDPIIYAYRMRNIQAALKKFFTCCRRKPVIPIQNSISSSRTVKTTNS